jgi:AcrR family transcriptional regulator
MSTEIGTSMVEGKRAAAMAENRAKLIRAARKAFATQGYAEASMDELTASVGLTRGALYHNFDDKKGLLWAVVEQIDGEMAERLRAIREQAPTLWQGLLAEGSAYIEMALDPEIQRIMLLDGPAVLGDPSKWPGENACLDITMRTIRSLIDEKVVKPLDVEAAGRLLNGAALSAALWVAAADNPKAVLEKAVDAFRELASGLLRKAV